MPCTTYREVDRHTRGQLHLHPPAGQTNLIGCETEDELFPYVYRVVRHRIRRAAPRCSDIAAVARFARQITRTIIRQGYGARDPRMRRVERATSTLQDNLTQVD